jgi:hypothetical protein
LDFFLLSTESWNLVDQAGNLGCIHFCNF